MKLTTTAKRNFVKKVISSLPEQEDYRKTIYFTVKPVLEEAVPVFLKKYLLTEKDTYTSRLRVWDNYVGYVGKNKGREVPYNSFVHIGVLGGSQEDILKIFYKNLDTYELTPLAKQVNALWDLHIKQSTKVKKLEVSLTNSLKCINTLEELQALYPKLRKYMPQPLKKVNVSTALTPSEITNELVTAGLK
jgi:hypothetical protein